MFPQFYLVTKQLFQFFLICCQPPLQHTYAYNHWLVNNHLYVPNLSNHTERKIFLFHYFFQSQYFQSWKPIRGQTPRWKTCRPNISKCGIKGTMRNCLFLYNFGYPTSRRGWKFRADLKSDGEVHAQASWHPALFHDINKLFLERP